MYGAGITVSPISVRPGHLVPNELALLYMHSARLSKSNSTSNFSGYILLERAILNYCFDAHLIHDPESRCFICYHVLEDGVLDKEAKASITKDTMPHRFFINRIKHFHFIDYHMCLSRIYVLLLTIGKSAIIHHYVTELNHKIDLLVTIESGIINFDIFGVYEQHSEAILIFGCIIDEPYIIFCVN